MFGRRWGKNTEAIDEAMDVALAGQSVGWFEPTYKYFSEAWREICHRLAPVTKRRDDQEKRLELLTGGLVEGWTCDTPDPGRGRKYHLVIVNEAGIIRGLKDIWQQSIRPTLTDYAGRALFLGTPKGAGHDFSALYRNAEPPLWARFTGSTLENPHIDAREVEAARQELPPEVFAQEYEGVPAPDGGNPFGLQHIAACVVKDPDQIKAMAKLSPIAFGWDFARSQDFTEGVGLSADWQVCRHHRWQGVAWGEQKARIQDLNGKTPAWGDATRSRVDDVIVQDLQRIGVPMQGVPFTYASRQGLMQRLQVVIQQHILRIPEGTIVTQLESFGYEYTALGPRYCLTPETRVLTADLRWVPVGNVRVGDDLIAFDEELQSSKHGRNWRRATVQSVGLLNRPCYRVTLSDGTSVIASDKHRWLVDTGQGGLEWRETASLRAPHPWSGSLRYAPSRLVKVLDTWSEPSSYQDGYLAAALDGEGSLSQRPRRDRIAQFTLKLNFSQRPNEMAEAFRTYLRLRGHEWSEHRGSGSALGFDILGGVPEILRLLGSAQPKRLLASFDPSMLGRMRAIATPYVTSLTFVGSHDVIALGTSTATVVAEGLASHNSAPEDVHDDGVIALALAVYGRDQMWVPQEPAGPQQDENTFAGWDWKSNQRKKRRYEQEPEPAKGWRPERFTTIPSRGDE